MPVADQITLVDFRRPNCLTGQPIQAEHGLSLLEFVCGGQVDVIRHHRCVPGHDRVWARAENVLVLVPLDRRILTWAAMPFCAGPRHVGQSFAGLMAERVTLVESKRALAVKIKTAK